MMNGEPRNRVLFGRWYRQHLRELLAALFLLSVIILVTASPGVASLLGVSGYETDLSNRYAPPGWPHVLGTDELGRDVLIRLLDGGRTSLWVGVIAGGGASLLGLFVGLLSGVAGGFWDSIAMRFTDAVIATPVLPLMLILAATDVGGWVTPLSWAFGIASAFMVSFVFWFGLPGWGQRTRFLVPGLALVGILILVAWAGLPLGGRASPPRGMEHSVAAIIIVIICFGWMPVARLVRATVVQTKSLDYVLASRGLGASGLHVVLVHLLPRALETTAVAASIEVAASMLYEASLSFLGFGVQPPHASWGSMLHQALDHLKQNVMLGIWPGVAIFLVVTSLHTLSEGWRRRFHPAELRRPWLAR